LNLQSYVTVHTAPDPRFERRGADLWRIETIEVVDAVLGVQRAIPTLNGPAKVTIPAGTQPDTVLRLRRKGVPEFGSDRRGDLYVAMQVHVPERLSRQERELYQQLRSLEGKSEPLRGPRVRCPSAAKGS
jgi:molecular chaperone DnaJ